MSDPTDTDATLRATVNPMIEKMDTIIEEGVMFDVGSNAIACVIANEVIIPALTTANRDLSALRQDPLIKEARQYIPEFGGQKLIYEADLISRLADALASSPPARDSAPDISEAKNTVEAIGRRSRKRAENLERVRVDEGVYAEIEFLLREAGSIERVLAELDRLTGSQS